jgi:hypothetical protein
MGAALPIMTAERAYGGRLIFDHLPKTAGQAINAWLVERLGSGCVTGNLRGMHRALIRNYGGQYSVISAHVTYRGGGLDPRYHYVTILRDPMDRAISWLFFILENHDREDAGKLWDEAERFLRSEGEDLGQVLAASLVNPYVRHFSDVLELGAHSDEVRLERALDAIAQYDVIGRYEQMGQFLSKLAAFIGIDAPKRIGRVNATLSRPPVDAVSNKLRDRIEQLVALDSAFYKAVCDRQKSLDDTKVQEVSFAPVWKTYVPVHDFTGEWNGQWAVAEFGLISASLQGASEVVPGELLEFAIEFTSVETLSDLVIGIHIVDGHDRRAFGTNNEMLEKPLKQVLPGVHRVIYFVTSDLPEGAYSVALNFIERTAHGDRQLGWFSRLLDFKVTVCRPAPSVGYAGLPVSMSYRQVSIVTPGLVSDARGTVVMLDTVREMGVAETVRLSARVQNDSPQPWANAEPTPIRFSCRWLDHTGTECHVRVAPTPLPIPELSPGNSVDVLVAISAPVLPGDYQLEVVPVQSGRRFDQFGFSPAVFSISVLPAGSARRYDGADVRFFTACGRRDGAAIYGSGREGFLLYGPYVTLAPGSYTVRIRGEFNDQTGSAWADVCHLQGALVLARCTYSNLTSERSFEMVFSLEKQASEIEIRLWIPGGADFRVDGVELGVAQPPPLSRDAESCNVIKDPDQDFSVSEPILEGRSTQSTDAN